MGRHHEYPLSDELFNNLGKLLVAVNKIREAYGKPMYVTSGYRPGIHNKKAGGATNSSHLTCEAVDFRDPQGKLAQWCISNLDKLVEAGLYMESPARTVGWVHLQIRPTRERIFQP